MIVTLPWGLPIKIDRQEAIGHNLATQGLYELGVTETLWRLTDPGDLAIDAGANIGYTASILGIRAGPTGSVICFEPHPQVFGSLAENVELWKLDGRCASFTLHQAALGQQSGRVLLSTDDEFKTNRGTAWISKNSEASRKTESVEVAIRSLDGLLETSEKIGVLKMDVQGFELDVLEGMTQILERRAVRDIVFEEHASFPAPTHKFLYDKGYVIFGLQEFFSGVRCLPDSQPVFDPVTGPIPNYLATLNAGRARARLGPRVWRSFGAGRLFPNPGGAFDERHL